ncbi:MAG TPA: hypothetical protein DEB06_04385 [Phycisphaerales bacterium]|nr:hypothetical protein [Phycisphaerales bacterium]
MKHRVWATSFGQWLVGLLILAVAQFQVQSLSRATLWMPIEWRVAVSIVAITIAMAVYGCVSRYRKRNENTQEMKKWYKCLPLRFTVALLVLLSCHIYLRSMTIIRWDLDELRDSPPQISEAPLLPAEGGASESGVESSASGRVVRPYWSGIADPQRNEIFVPLWYPKVLQGEIALREAGSQEHATGQLSLMQKEIFHFLDVLIVEARGQYSFTVAICLIIHVLLLCSFAGFLAFIITSASDALAEALVARTAPTPSP